jgi:very-short-patch-repair endonuclease
MPNKRDSSWRLRGFARVMRHNPTDAEKLLWSKLRDRQLDGLKFRRQVPVDGSIVDFLCLSAKLAVELDGGQHMEPEQMRRDALRSERVRAKGFREMRVSNIDVLRDVDLVLNEILRAAGQNPHPCPLPEYRERG